MPKFKLSNLVQLLVLIVVVLGIIGLIWFLVYTAFFQKQLEPNQEVIINPSLIRQTADISRDSYQIESVSRGWEVPWSLGFLDSDILLVAERKGVISSFNLNNMERNEILTIPDVSSNSEEGLMGMVTDPDFDINPFIYICYAYNVDGSLKDKVVKYRFDGASLSQDSILIDNIPAAQFHAGCRLGFGPDDKLYITTGDATDRNLAQDLNSLAGKILRINTDGSIPDDNPITGSRVYSYGHRNPQGIAWNKDTNTMYSTEHGPSIFDGPAGGDEVNVIKGGGNYGWPIVSHTDSREGLVSPLLVFTPAEAPASAMVYDGESFNQFKGDLFFGALRGEGIIRIRFNPQNPQEVLSYAKLDIGNLGRIREIVQGPDGYIYFTSSNRDGRGEILDGDDKIYRIKPNGD